MFKNVILSLSICDFNSVNNVDSINSVTSIFKSKCKFFKSYEWGSTNQFIFLNINIVEIFEKTRTYGSIFENVIMINLCLGHLKMEFGKGWVP